LSALWFVLLGFFARQLDARPLIVLGIITTLLNSFVFFVRWGWFKIQPIRTNPSLVFCDIIIHALVPLATLVSIVVMLKNVDSSKTQACVAQGILGFWVILVLWYAINYALVKTNRLPWPYTNGAGVSLPQDIYQNQSSAKRPYIAYMTLNFLIALLLTMLCLMAVYGTQ
jgi:hypothetical protein